MTDANRVKKINMKLSKIRETVEKQGNYGYYLIDDDDVKLVSKADDKDVAEENFLEKIKGKKKYVNNFVYVVDLVIDGKYVANEHKLVGGPVSLKIKQYHIDPKYNLKYKSGYKNGAIWYTNQDLLDGAFHFTDIKKIIKIIHDNNVNILSVGKVRAVDMLNENFE